MSRTQKEKLQAYTSASLQILSDDAEEERDVTVADCYIELSLEARKIEANKPLYLKRI